MGVDPQRTSLSLRLLFRLVVAPPAIVLFLEQAVLGLIHPPFELFHAVEERADRDGGRHDRGQVDDGDNRDGDVIDLDRQDIQKDGRKAPRQPRRDDEWIGRHSCSIKWRMAPTPTRGASRGVRSLVIPSSPARIALMRAGSSTAKRLVTSFPMAWPRSGLPIFPPTLIRVFRVNGSRA